MAIPRDKMLEIGKDFADKVANGEIDENELLSYINDPDPKAKAISRAYRMFVNIQQGADIQQKLSTGRYTPEQVKENPTATRLLQDYHYAQEDESVKTKLRDFGLDLQKVVASAWLKSPPAQVAKRIVTPLIEGVTMKEERRASEEQEKAFMAWTRGEELTPEQQALVKQGEVPLKSVGFGDITDPFALPETIGMFAFVGIPVGAAKGALQEAGLGFMFPFLERARQILGREKVEHITATELALTTLLGGAAGAFFGGRAAGEQVAQLAQIKQGLRRFEAEHKVKIPEEVYMEMEKIAETRPSPEEIAGFAGQEPVTGPEAFAETVAPKPITRGKMRATETLTKVEKGARRKQLLDKYQGRVTATMHEMDAKTQIARLKEYDPSLTDKEIKNVMKVRNDFDAQVKRAAKQIDSATGKTGKTDTETKIRRRTKALQDYGDDDSDIATAFNDAWDSVVREQQQEVQAPSGFVTKLRKAYKEMTEGEGRYTKPSEKGFAFVRYKRLPVGAKGIVKRGKKGVKTGPRKPAFVLFDNAEKIIPWKEYPRTKELVEKIYTRGNRRAPVKGLVKTINRLARGRGSPAEVTAGMKRLRRAKAWDEDEIHEMLQLMRNERQELPVEPAPTYGSAAPRKGAVYETPKKSQERGIPESEQTREYKSLTEEEQLPERKGEEVVTRKQQRAEEAIAGKKQYFPQETIERMRKEQRAKGEKSHAEKVMEELRRERGEEPITVKKVEEPVRKTAPPKEPGGTTGPVPTEPTGFPSQSTGKQSAYEMRQIEQWVRDNAHRLSESDMRARMLAADMTDKQIKMALKEYPRTPKAPPQVETVETLDIPAYKKGAPESARVVDDGSIKLAEDIPEPDLRAEAMQFEAKINEKATESGMNPVSLTKLLNSYGDAQLHKAIGGELIRGHNENSLVNTLKIVGTQGDRTRPIYDHYIGAGAQDKLRRPYQALKKLFTDDELNLWSDFFKRRYISLSSDVNLLYMTKERQFYEQILRMSKNPKYDFRLAPKEEVQIRNYVKQLDAQLAKYDVPEHLMHADEMPPMDEETQKFYDHLQQSVEEMEALEGRGTAEYERTGRKAAPREPGEGPAPPKEEEIWGFYTDDELPEMGEYMNKRMPEALNQIKKRGEKGAITIGKRLDEVTSPDPLVDEVLKAGTKEMPAFSRFSNWVRGKIERTEAFAMYEPLLKMFPHLRPAFRRMRGAAGDAIVHGRNGVVSVLAHLMDETSMTPRRGLKVFENYLQLRNLEYNGLKGLRLPKDMTLEQITTELTRLEEKEITPAIRAALNEHRKLVEISWREYLWKRGLVDSKTSPNKWYFPLEYLDPLNEQVMKYFPFVPRRFRKPWRPYLLERVGSPKVPYGDYIDVMSRHLATLHLHNAMDDFIHMTAGVESLSDDAIRGALVETFGPKRALEKLNLGRGSIQAALDPRERLIYKGRSYTPWQDQPGNRFFIGSTMSEKSLMDMVANASFEERLRIAKENVKPILAMGRKNFMYVIPTELAERLSHFREPIEFGLVDREISYALSMWKSWAINTAFAGYHVINMFTDMFAVALDQPGAFKYLPEMVKEFAKGRSGQASFWHEMALKQRLTEAGIAQDIFGRARLDPRLRAFQTWGDFLGKEVGEALRANPFNIMRTIGEYRETPLRMAIMKHAWQKIHTGTETEIPKSLLVDLKGLRIEDIPGELGRNLTVDYAALNPQLAKFTRNMWFPFATWYIKFNQNLMRGIWKGGVKDMRVLGATLGTYGALQLWNNILFPNVEEDLPHYKRLMPHLNTGFTWGGKHVIFDLFQPVEILYDITGLSTAQPLITEVRQGRMTAGEAAQKWITSLPSDIGMTLYGLVNPFATVAFSLATNKDYRTGRQLVPNELIGTDMEWELQKRYALDQLVAVVGLYHRWQNADETPSSINFFNRFVDYIPVTQGTLEANVNDRFRVDSDQNGKLARIGQAWIDSIIEDNPEIYDNTIDAISKEPGATVSGQDILNWINKPSMQTELARREWIADKHNEDKKSYYFWLKQYHAGRLQTPKRKSGRPQVQQRPLPEESDFKDAKERIKRMLGHLGSSFNVFGDEEK